MIHRKIIRALSLAKLSLETAWDLARYPSRGEAGAKTWEAFMRLHCMTNGRSTAFLRRAMEKWKPPPSPIFPFESMLGGFDASSLNSVADQIRRDGYYIFPDRLPDSLCDEIADNVRSFDGWAWRNHNGLQPVGHFDPDHPTAHRYELPEPKIWQIPAYQKIIADPIFINLSQSYFNAIPLLKEVGLWWSAAVDDGAPDDDAAQLFHFDYDAAPIWLKYFVYLSDVTSETGPHIFVKGSHRLRQERARKLLARGYVRISDDEIAQTFGAENIVEIAGRKGTVFAADTMAFHKGKPPVTGHRLLAQLEFATPLFVPVTSRPLAMPANAEPKLLAARRSYPWAFARFPARV